MSPSSILNAFIVLSLAEFGWSSVLLALNYRDAYLGRSRVPMEFAGWLSAAEAAKAADYSRAKMRFSFVRSAVSTFAVLIAAASGLFGALDARLSGMIASAYWLGAAFLGILVLAQALLSAPFSLYLSFRVEKRFGFNTMTARTWILDALKALFLNAALGLPLLLLLYAFMDWTGGLWWLWAAIVFSAIDIAISLLYPLLVAPLFNRFKPLEEGSLRLKIDALAERLSFKKGGVFVMDGSKRSRHSNAYFTGMGRMKRIVLYDTLLETMSEEEVLAVLAHEIGHEKKLHVLKLTGIAVAAAFLGFFILGLCSLWADLYAAFGFRGPSRHALILVLSLASGPAGFFLSPLLASMSRRHEYQADAYAAAATSPAALGSALLKLNKENASNLWPNRLYSAWHSSHPELRDRLAAIGFKP